MVWKFEEATLQRQNQELHHLQKIRFQGKLLNPIRKKRRRFQNYIQAHSGKQKNDDKKKEAWNSPIHFFAHVPTKQNRFPLAVRGSPAVPNTRPDRRTEPPANRTTPSLLCRIAFQVGWIFGVGRWKIFSHSWVNLVCKGKCDGWSKIMCL